MHGLLLLLLQTPAKKKCVVQLSLFMPTEFCDNQMRVSVREIA